MFAEDVLVEALGRLGFVDCVYHEVPVDLRDYYQVRGGRARTFQKAEILILRSPLADLLLISTPLSVGSEI